MGSWLMGRLLSRHLLPGAHQCHSPTCSLALQKYAGIWIGTQRGQLPISSTVKATEGVCHEISTEGNLGCKITPHSRNLGLKVLLLSRYYLRPRGRLTKLGEKNMSLRMDRKKCRIYGPQGKPTQQLCWISPDWVKCNSIRGRLQPPTHGPLTQETHQPKRRERLSMWIN